MVSQTTRREAAAILGVVGCSTIRSDYSNFITCRLSVTAMLRPKIDRYRKLTDRAILSVEYSWSLSTTSVFWLVYSVSSVIQRWSRDEMTDGSIFLRWERFDHCSKSNCMNNLMICERWPSRGQNLSEVPPPPENTRQTCLCDFAPPCNIQRLYQWFVKFHNFL